MEKEFISHDLALDLAKLNFNEKCFGYYGIENELKIEISSNLDTNLTRRDFYAAPLCQQAFRWFREKYGYNCFITSSKLDGKWYYFREDLDDRWNDSEPELTPKFDSFEEAELACLKKLIEIVKNK